MFLQATFFHIGSGRPPLDAVQLKKKHAPIVSVAMACDWQ